MMKKLSKIFVCTLMVVLLLGTLTACGNNTNNDKDIAVLQMDTRYIAAYIINKEDLYDYLNEYYIFHNNGTGEYRYSTSFEDYTITFKYTFVDADKSAVMCFYDSVKYEPTNTATSDVATNWTRLVTVSKNVLCYATTGAYGYYINENYAQKNLPHYNEI